MQDLTGRARRDRVKIFQKSERAAMRRGSRDQTCGLQQQDTANVYQPCTQCQGNNYPASLSSGLIDILLALPIGQHSISPSVGEVVDVVYKGQLPGVQGIAERTHLKDKLKMSSM